MERVAEINQAIEAGTVEDETLAELHTELVELFEQVTAGEVEGVAATDVEALAEIVDTAELVGGVAAARIEAAAEAAAQVAELEARIRPVVVDIDDELTDDAPQPEGMVDDVTEEEVAEVVAEAEALVEEAAEPVTAAAEEVERPALSQLSKAQPAKSKPRVVVKPSARIYGQTGELAGFGDVAKALAEAHNGGVAGAYGNRVRVARIVADYPSDRVLAEMDGTATEDKIAAVVAAGQNPDAIVASGGYCAPTDVDYGLVQIAGTARSVRDSLPSFQAARGGLRVATSPTLADVVTSFDASDPDAAVSVWDNDTDVDPSGATKGIQEIPCPEFNEYLTAAVVKRLKVSNFGARAYPEKVQQFTELALAAHARVGETRLIDGIKNASTAVTVPQTFGAARDIAEAIKRAAAAYRSRHRAPNVVLRALVPRWIVTLGDVDLMRGLQSDAAFVRDGEAIFRDALAVAGVNVTLYDDSPTTGESQIFAAQGAGALKPFPNTVQWGLYDEGHHLFLDGGTLDLGIVRDSTLNATNDYETFVETFEGLAPRGVESLWITSAVCPDGTSANGVDDAVACGS